MPGAATAAAMMSGVGPFTNAGTITTTANTPSVDLLVAGALHDGMLAAVLLVGSVTGTNPTLDAKVQDSADNSAFADVPGAVLPQVTTTGAVHAVAFLKANVRRYVRLAYTVAGTTPVFQLASALIGARKGS